MRTLLICMVCVITVYAQYDGPTPPRLQLVPGAIPVGGPRQSGYRQGRYQAAPVAGPPARIRRPLARPSFKSVDAAPRPSLQSLEEPAAKPVTEEPEDDYEINTPTAFSPNIFSTAEPQNDFYDITTTSQPKPPIAFNPSPYPQSTPSVPKPEPIKPTQYRPLLSPQPFNPIRNEPINKPQPQRLQPLSSRPQRPVFRPEPKPFIEDDEVPIQPVRQYNRPQEPINRAPVKAAAPQQKYSPSHQREKKPVAQIIRKYREENEDGSITWGFENDDGSFKEEIIGNNCVTRGKYGYVDPDGLKREYNYETGIPCDKVKDEQDEKGFVDYQENKAVLPNGITIDLAAMGKKSKRPFRSAANH